MDPRSPTAWHRPRAPAGARSWAVLALLAFAPVPGAGGTATRRVAEARPSFALSRAFYGPRAWADPAARASLRAGLLNAVSFWTPLDSGLEQLLVEHPASAIVNLAGASGVEGLPPDAIERERLAIARLRASGLDVSWNLMEEWDQGGGRWVPGGRPRYAGLSRRQALARFTSHYLEASAPLGTYLKRPRGARDVPLVAQTDYAVNARYAFELGVDECLLERGIDELGDLSTGIAFVRGAAREYGRTWGIDLSLWRTGNDAATRFDARGALTGGWSPSYVRRHLYLAYLSGARLVQLEPALQHDEHGALNPLGRAVEEFADFALRRHPDLGRPVVPLALMTGHDIGFDPKHGVYGQGDAVWYGDLPYSDGDHMLDQLLRVAYPGHWLHGLAPGAPFASPSGAPDPAAFRRFLAAGGDPRPYEPMPATRWGGGLDVIDDRATAPALARYRVVALVGDVALDARLRGELEAWVREGGVLVVNARQVTAADEPLLGVRLGRPDGRAARSRWLDGAVLDEPGFAFTRVTPGAARVLAATDRGEPLVTSRALGRGRVILTTPDWMLSSARDRLLRIAVRLLDSLHDEHAVASVEGDPIAWIVDRAPGRTTVALVNGSGTAWRGRVAFRAAPGSFRVREYVRDAPAAHARSGDRVVVPVEVAPWDVAVYALEAR